MSAPEIANLLRAIANLIERGSLSEINAITRTLTGPVQAVRNEKVRANEKSDKGKGPDIGIITERIFNSPDRITAKSVLEEANLSRRDLKLLGEKNSVHIRKEDKVNEIEMKIVEALVGSRLNSKAIRGEN